MRKPCAHSKLCLIPVTVSTNKTTKTHLIFSFLFLPSLVIGQEIEFISNSRYVLGEDKDMSASVSAGDIDNDGDIEIIVANGRHWPEYNKVFINNGYGVFTVSELLDDIAETSYATELADFDGDLDVAVGNDMAPNAIYLNDGLGNFIRSGNFGNPYSPTRNIKTTDIDSDGDIDILITNCGRENEICLNNGKGQFTRIVNFGSKDDSTIDVDVADLNSDGKKDLILANRDGQQNFMYLNDGDLNFNKKHLLVLEQTKPGL